MTASDPSALRNNMQQFNTFAEMQLQVRNWKRSGATIGVVPTMGALHAGHLSLIEIAQKQVDRVIATIFVNPTQFAPQEDLGQYPRTLADDLKQLRTLGTDAVFVPANEEVYPPDFSTFVDPPRVSLEWEGAIRPIHFRGVATVVLKLLNGTQADLAVFGQKDFQQAAVIKAMVRDLNHPCEILVAPIFREPSGLAMSSRNRYLSSVERTRAGAIYQAILAARAKFSEHPSGTLSADELETLMREHLRAGGITDIDYIALVDPDSLQRLDCLTNPTAVLVAVRVGSTRLIDNDILSL